MRLLRNGMFFLLLVLIIAVAGCGGGDGDSEGAYSVIGAVTSADGISGIEGVKVSFGSGGTETTDANGEFRRSGLTAPDTVTVESRTGWTFNTNTRNIDQYNNKPIFYLTGFNEEFNNNNNDWGYVNESGVKSSITGGCYRFVFTDDQYSALVLVPLGLSADYTLDAWAQSTSSAGEYGLAFNLTDWSQYHYLLIIDPDARSWEIVKRRKLSGQNPEFVRVSYGTSSMIYTTGMNTISLTVSGNKITTLKINNSSNLLTSDITIPSGEIYADHWAALYAGTWAGETATIQFDKFSFTAKVTAASSSYISKGIYGKKVFEKTSTGPSLRSR